MSNNSGRKLRLFCPGALSKVIENSGAGESSLGECRNCGSRDTEGLGFIGEVAPFFLKRVLNVEYGVAPTGHPIKRVLRKLGIVAKAFQRIYGKSVLVEMQICGHCSFIQTKKPFEEEAIANLYADYRSGTYNRERIQYEPEYASIASCVGGSAQEVQTRKAGLTQWLTGKLHPEIDFSMLDYGGANGMFLPDLPGRKYVFDISDIAAADGIARIRAESELSFYSYIQLAHVLEHVPFPLALAKKAVSHLRDSGHLYVEVPQELGKDLMARIADRDKTIRLPIHEHINQYCVNSVTELLRSANLLPIAVQCEFMDLGWNRGLVIRALGKKSCL